MTFLGSLFKDAPQGNMQFTSTLMICRRFFPFWVKPYFVDFLNKGPSSCQNWWQSFAQVCSCGQVQARVAYVCFWPQGSWTIGNVGHSSKGYGERFRICFAKRRRVGFTGKLRLRAQKLVVGNPTASCQTTICLPILPKIPSVRRPCRLSQHHVFVEPLSMLLLTLLLQIILTS